MLKFKLETETKKIYLIFPNKKKFWFIELPPFSRFAIHLPNRFSIKNNFYLSEDFNHSIDNRFEEHFSWCCKLAANINYVKKLKSM